MASIDNIPRLISACSQDERHQQPSDAVIKKRCERAYAQFDDSRYQRLAGISASRLYN